MNDVEDQLNEPKRNTKMDDRLTTVEVKLAGVQAMLTTQGSVLTNINTKLTEVSTTLAASTQSKGIPVGNLIASLSAIAAWSVICGTIVWLMIAPIATAVNEHHNLGYHAGAGERMSQTEGNIVTLQNSVDSLDTSLKSLILDLSIKTQERYTKLDAQYDKDKSHETNMAQDNKIDELIEQVSMLKGTIEKQVQRE